MSKGYTVYGEVMTWIKRNYGVRPFYTTEIVIPHLSNQQKHASIQHGTKQGLLIYTGIVTKGEGNRPAQQMQMVKFLAVDIEPEQVEAPICGGLDLLMGWALKNDVKSDKKQRNLSQ